MTRLLKCLLALALVSLLWAQPHAAAPRFEDYSVGEFWHSTPATAKLTSRSERMFRTQLTTAATQPPNFASHYRITYWGCGSNCSAAAVIDLQTGKVFQPPLAKPDGSGWERWITCTAAFEGAFDEFRVDSRLMITRCGMNFSERLQKDVPDTWFFLWDGDHFRQILRVPGSSSSK